MMPSIKQVLLEELEETRVNLKLSGFLPISRRVSLVITISMVILFFLLLVPPNLVKIQIVSYLVIILSSAASIILFISFIWFFLTSLLLFVRSPIIFSPKLLELYTTKTIYRKKSFVNGVKQKFSHFIMKMCFFNLGNNLGFDVSEEYYVNREKLDIFWKSKKGNVGIEIEEEFKISANKKSILKIINNSKEIGMKMGIITTLLNEDQIKKTFNQLKEELQIRQIGILPFPCLVVFPLIKKHILVRINENKEIIFS